MSKQNGIRRNTLIVIAGASGAGKSTLARRIENELKVPHYELDRVFNLLKRPFDGMAIESDALRKQYRQDVTAALVPEILNSFVDLNVSAVVEGGWLSPKEVRTLQLQSKSIVPLFLGYGGTGRNRLEQFQRGTTHWSSEKVLSSAERERVEEFFDKQVRKSVSLKRECEDSGLKYLDTTEESGFEAAFQYLKTEIEKNCLPVRSKP
ncbi:hypothetical protein [Roseibium sp. SCP14]|uniref:hypothetical protein n=1 Tax=Roseibium sp. SCP14 TaxID=3141375 RepID=UPI003337C551